MSYTVHFLVRAEFPGGRSGHLRKTVDLPFPAHTMSEDMLLTVDSTLPNARINELRYSVPSGQFQIRLVPDVRNRPNEQRAEFLARVAKDGWQLVEN